MSWRRQYGFTITELVVTMIVAGLLAAVAIPRMMGPQGFESRGYFDAAAAAVRYAQKTAIAQRRNVFVQWTATTVTLCYSAAMPCAAANQVVDPVSGNTSFTVDAQHGTSATAAVNVAPANTVFGFNALGQPISAASLVLGANTVYTFNPVETGDVVRTLTIVQDTGYVF